MKIKKIITGGCSFSDKWTYQSWPFRLADELKKDYPDLSFTHTGMGSQGQELIQKKCSLAVIEELEKYKPEELAVIIMWSGTERKAFYVDDSDYIADIVQTWSDRSLSWGNQFTDLRSNVSRNTEKISVVSDSKTTKYNPNGGWYTCNYLMPDSKLTDEYFRTMSTPIGAVTISLENIVMLQNLCKLKGVKIYHAFYRNYVYNDIEKYKDHLNLNYLYKQLDNDTIITTTGIFEYLRPVDESDHIQWSHGDVFKYVFKLGKDTDETTKYFEIDNWHPNQLGHTKWTTEVLIPTLKTKSFFE